MDDYIKRKRKSISESKKEPIKAENGTEQILRESRQELNDLFCKVEYVESRLKVVKEKLNEEELKHLNITNNRKVLGEPPVQRSEIENSLFNRQTSESNQIIEQTQELDGVEELDKIGIDPETRREDNVVANEKLPLTGKNSILKRKLKKRT